MELHYVPLSLSPQSPREDEDTFFKCQGSEMCGGAVGAVKSELLAAMACGIFRAGGQVGLVDLAED